MSALQTLRSLVPALALLSGSMSVAEIAAVEPNQIPPEVDLPPGRVQMGVHALDQQAETSGDVLIPVMAFSSGLVFVNPRGAWNDQAGREMNLGMGCRRLFPQKNIIVGINAFYDRRESSLGNLFNQFGLGAEFLSVWVDARANVYCPEGGARIMDYHSVTTAFRREYLETWFDPTGEGHLITQSGYDSTDIYQVKTTQHFQEAERAMEGFDAELGVLLPVPRLRDYVDIKVFVGCYDFNAHYGKDLAGMKGRLEIKPMPAVAFDAAWYEDKELLQSRYSVGVRASMPFDLGNLSRGRNPFAGALTGFRRTPGRTPFACRLTDMVIRDLHVRTDVSPLEEVVADRTESQVLVSHERHDYREVLASDVTFVDGDNQGRPADGSWENPYPSIREGVQGAVGHLVYVRDAATAYRESVTLKDGQSLWGSGAVIQGRGNRFMGGVYPVLNSDGTGPAVILGNQTTIAGMGIVQAPSTSPQDGIYGRNVSGIVLRDNIVEGHGRMLSGIHLEGVSLPVFMATIRNNRISGAQGSGIEITLDDGGTTDLVLTGNKSIGNGVHGVSIVASLTDGGARIDLNSLVTSGNQAHGVSLDVNAFGGSVDVDIHNMAAEHNRYCGISGYLWGADGLTIAATGNSLGHNLDSGMMVEAYSGGSLASDFVSNDFSRNAYYGFVLSLNSGLGSTVTGRGNRFDDNGIQGFGLMSKSLAGTYDFGTEASPGLNRFSGNGQWQVVYSGMDVLSARGNWWGTPLPTQGVEYLSGGGGSIDASDPLPSPP